MMRKTLCAGVCLVLLSGCGGGGSSPLPGGGAGAPPAPPTGRVASAHVVISIPARSANAAKPAYVSPSTKSVTVQVDSGAAVTQNLSPSAPNCSSAGANYPLDCIVTVSASAGAHTLTFATFDQQSAAGNRLSINSIAVTFAAGQNPSIPVVLAGVPASLTVIPAAGATTIASSDPLLASQQELQWTWGAPHNVLVFSSDADGNYIVGPGAPTISFSSSATDGTPNVTISAASSSNPNEYTLQSSAAGYGTISITATPSSALAGSPLTKTIAFASVAASTVVYSDPTQQSMGATFGLTFDPVNDNLYAENVSYTFCGMSQVTLGGTLSNFAGGSTCGFADGTGSAAALYYSSNGNSGGNGAADGNVTYDSNDGNIYIADSDNCAVRRVTPNGVVTTIAGSAPPTVTCYSFADGTGSAAKFFSPSGMVYDASTDAFYVADECDIRKVTAAGVVTTIAGPQPPTFSCGFTDSTDGTGATARFKWGGAIALDTQDGNLYVVDPQNCSVRQVNPVTGNTVTIAGVGPNVGRGSTNCSYLDGVGRAAKFDNPVSIAYDPDNGQLYIGDPHNLALRQLDPTTGVVVTVAGPPPPTRVPLSSYLPAAGIGSTIPISTARGLVYDHATGSLYITQGPGIMRLQL